ncbi:MAG: tRNA (N6-threonylcarbamoyladenosine(37)-N6)-methyltransferase TrmO [Candidatus Marinimicrobia bacterium]|nr:tRNA (N6-threonylcarbamoyladenosine(37)-N6)-methyltransferase TrmO [Candidatus Neomarinimicrobiota bacterium]
MNKLQYTSIGIIRSPFKEAKGTPIQFSAAQDIEGKVEVDPDYAEGLQDLRDFSHIILIYHFHRVKNAALKVTPFMDDKKHGIFSTRAPNRPNPIGFSVVKLNKIEANILHVSGMDIIDGTPLLDIKPYVPEFDIINTDQKGWLEKNVKKLQEAKDDGRFIDDK